MALHSVAECLCVLQLILVFLTLTSAEESIKRPGDYLKREHSLIRPYTGNVVCVNALLKLPLSMIKVVEF